MPNCIIHVPTPENEPVLTYAPGTPERAEIVSRLEQMQQEEIEIPVIVGGREIRTGRTRDVTAPHDHQHRLGVAHLAAQKEVEQAIAAAREAWHDWSEMPWEDRAAVFLKAAELLAGPWRATVNAACMLGQSKTVHQAEIDSACELIDFWRFNPSYMREIYAQQSRSTRGVWNYLEYRPLEGFVLAVTPFNFTSIAGNLPTSPAMMGNTVLWKPASAALPSTYYVMKVLQAAGLPDGVINFLPGVGPEVGDPALASPALAGVHFTGSTATFQGMWKTIGANIARYHTYPRIVGETGGKDFVFAHPSASVPALAAALVRGAYEYQGQKCSAVSRCYVPASLWPSLEERLLDLRSQIRMGPPTDLRNFMAAVIDEGSFRSIVGYLDEARSSSSYEILGGGGSDASVGYYVEPTVIQTKDPRGRLMVEEIFGPVLTVFVYPDAELDEAVKLCNTTSPYGLTGAVFAEDRRAISRIAGALRHAAGNFYINDKPTGAVVSQQPFGGSRASGTNDKAGSLMNLMRWTSQRAIKETFLPATDFTYPHMAEEG
jgi:1-pyrroline-5-carboxylate dehydrogenase